MQNQSKTDAGAKTHIANTIKLNPDDNNNDDNDNRENFDDPLEYVIPPPPAPAPSPKSPRPTRYPMANTLSTGYHNIQRLTQYPLTNVWITLPERPKDGNDEVKGP